MTFAEIQEAMAAEPPRIPGVIVRGKNGALPTHLPSRLHPMRDLLTSVDPSDRLVLDDWIESQSWNVAHDLWLLTKPTDFQKKITIMVIGRGTNLGHYPDAHKHTRSYRSEAEDREICELAIAEGRRQLAIHRHAHWIRLIDAAAQTTAQGEEALMDHAGSPAWDDGRKVVHFRTRCQVAGCVISSTGTQRTSESNTDTQSKERT